MINLWKMISEEDVSPSPWFKVFKRKYQMPNGKMIDDFYVSKLGDVSMVLVLTDKKEVVFVKQYKAGIDKIMLELPAGRIKKDKTAEEVARLELKEETGLEVRSLIKLGELSEVPSKDPIVVTAFFSNEIVNKGDVEFDETENIEMVLVPMEDIDKMVVSGQIWASSTLSTLYLAKANGYLK